MRLLAAAEGVRNTGEVVWADDSSKVAFVLQSSWAVVWDVKRRSLVALDLVNRRNTSFPPPEMAVRTRFGDDGTSLFFDRCEREDLAHENDCVSESLALTASRPYPLGSGYPWPTLR